MQAEQYRSGSLLSRYLNDHGLPLALYSDIHSIFRVNNPEREGELAQFTRAIKTLERITTGLLRRLVLLITPILMYTILKRNWTISSASR